MGFFGNLFSRQACAICGKEVGALSRTKLKDGNYICGDCKKNTSRLFRLGHHDLESVQAHLAYMEKQNTLYEKEFAPLSKDQIDYCGHHGSHKIGFADSIGMFEIVSPEMKKSNKRELFRYDQIDSFGPYYIENSMNRSEGERRFKEYGVSIKLRCALDPRQMNASEKELATMHPYAIELKVPLQHNVDNPSGGDRIYQHLSAIFGAKMDGAAGAASKIANFVLGAPTAAMIPFSSFNKDNLAKYTKLADEAEKRALGQLIRENNN